MRSSQQPLTGSFQQNLSRSPEPTNIRRPSSIDRAQAGRSIVSNPVELPYVDPQARYSISYVPGMSEHVVNTGKTLPEAQLKVVLLACEVERLNTLNYNLVKENEILKVQAKKSDRETDLETKLAIVLAENEKLNQIVEELHAVYARERESLTNEDYERRINELLQDLEEWKAKYSRLEGVQIGSVDTQAILALEKEREALKEQLGRQGRDLEALRARLSSIQVGGPVDNKSLQEELSTLRIQNSSLASELDAMKLKYGNADALQQRLGQYDAKLRVLLAENDKLNNLLSEKAREAQNKQGGQGQVRDINVVLPAEREKEKSAGANVIAPAQDTSNYKEIITRLTRDNEELKTLLTHSQSASAAVADLREKINRLVAENDRLNSLVLELRAENEKHRKPITDLGVQVNDLLNENRKLNDALQDRLREVDTLRLRIRDLEVNQGPSGDVLNKLAILTSENERLNGLIVEVRAENERLRKANVDATRITQLTTQINGLLDENRRLNDLLNEKASETDRQRRRIAELEAASLSQGRNDVLTSENERLNNLIIQIRNENDVLRKQAGDSQRLAQLSSQLNSLLDENQRLNNLLIERSNEINTLRRRITDLEGQGSSSATELRDKLVFVTSENERLNKDILSLRAEIDRLRIANADVNKVAQLTSQINTLIDDNRRLNNSLLEKTGDSEIARRRLAEIEATIQTLRAENDRLRQSGGDSTRLNQLTIQINTLLDENKRLNDTLVSRSREIDDLRRRLAEAGTGTGNANDIRSQYVLLAADNERLARELEEERRRVATSSITNIYSSQEDLRPKIDLLARENDKLNVLLQDKLRENENLRGAAAERDRINAQYLDRLREVETLRVRVSQLELGGGAGNSELVARIESLNKEIDILRRNLAERNAELEQLRRGSVPTTTGGDKQRVEILLQENERLNGLLTSKVREADILRSRIGDLERELGTEREKWNILLQEKQREIDALRGDQGRVYETALSDLRSSEVAKNTSLKSSAMVRHDDAIKSLESRIRFLDEEVKRLTELVLQRDRELAEARGRTGEVEFIRQENERLNGLLTDRLREIEELRRGQQGHMSEAEYKRLLDAQISELTIRFGEEKNGLSASLREVEDRLIALTADNERLVAQGDQDRNEIENWKRKFEQLERQRIADLDMMKQDYEKRVRDSPIRRSQMLQQTAAELQQSNDLLVADIERLQDHLNLALGELEEARKKLKQVEITRAQEIEELRKQFEEARRLNIEARDIHVKFNAERLAYETQILQLQQRISDLEAQNSMVTNESDRYGKLSASRLEEADEYRRKYNELKAAQNIELATLKSQVESYKARGQEVKQLAIKYSADKAADQAQIRQLKQIIENYKSEIEKLHELLEQSKTDFASLTKLNEEFTAQIERLTLQQTKVEGSTVTERIEILQRELDEAVNGREEYKKQAQRNSLELTRRNKELVDKLQELDIIKMKYEEALANYQALNTRLFERLNTV